MLFRFNSKAFGKGPRFGHNAGLSAHYALFSRTYLFFIDIIANMGFIYKFNCRKGA